MKLSPVVFRYFDAWIRHDTWDSLHTLDDERFYRFVKAVLRYSRRRLSPGDLEEIIVDRWKKRRVSSALDRAAERYRKLYRTLVAYETTTGFPDALIEQTNILKCYNQLRRRQKGKQSTDYIQRKMAEDWGNDWETKLKHAINKKTGLRP